jgi:hypothetical protein
MQIEFNLGIDQARAHIENGQLEADHPAPMIALEVDYGNLLPVFGKDHVDPFEFFEFYASLNLMEEEIRGAQVYSTGLLYGFSRKLSDDPGRLRDNNVFGFTMSYEYVDANFGHYSAIGVGPGDYLVFRLERGKGLRIGAGLDVVPVLGASSLVADPLRQYNFATGVAPWANLKLWMGPFGELGLRTRHYVTTIVDGVEGDEFVGSMRLWYEIDIVDGIDVGVAPTLLYRRGLYRDHRDYSLQQLSTQFYLSLH